MTGEKDKEWLLKEKYGGVEGVAFHADCERLASGEPLGYVIGWTQFLDCKIYLDLPAMPAHAGQAGSHPLIPRLETEFWVEKAIREINRNVPRHVPVLDMCAGSGCIGVAIAKATPETHVDFAEIDKLLLPTIEKNLTKNLPIDWKVFGRYNLYQSDLFENIKGQYNFILCNPPYIDKGKDRTEKSVKNYEPHLALYGGQGGLEIIKSIISTAPNHLTPNGQLWLEHEPEQSKEIQKLAEKAGFSINTHTDQYGVERYSVLMIQ